MIGGPTTTTRAGCTAGDCVRLALRHERMGRTSPDAGSVARMQSGARYYWAKALQSLLMAWRPE